MSQNRYILKPETSDWLRLKEIFENPALQMATFTITEKGYQIKNASGYLPQIKEDMQVGPEQAKSYMGCLTALCYLRYLAGKLPLALVSMDNFSHNGDRLKMAVLTIAEVWEKNNLVEEGFSGYLQDETKISFPWSMIDKITPRPDSKIKEMLERTGLEGMDIFTTSANTYIAPFVNAEETEYLVIEDNFPNGRPKLEHAGILFADRRTVECVEQMKVCTCLNPLHTGLAIFGCLLSYTSISKEMEDPLLRELAVQIGQEGMPVVVHPGILEPKQFLHEVLYVRLPNPYIPDTPQRIATDTSQKLSIRYGETIKAYQKTGKSLEQLAGNTVGHCGVDPLSYRSGRFRKCNGTQPGSAYDRIARENIRYCGETGNGGRIDSGRCICIWAGSFKDGVGRAGDRIFERNADGSSCSTENIGKIFGTVNYRNFRNR